jgi:hypothetical protein
MKVSMNTNGHSIRPAGASAFAPVERLEFRIAQVLELLVHQRRIQVVQQWRLERDVRTTILQ